MENLEKQNLLAEMLNRMKRKHQDLTPSSIDEYISVEDVRYGLGLAMDIIEKEIEELTNG